MPSSPVVKRYYRGDCTRCGRPRGTLELWCARCVRETLDRGMRNADNPGHWLSDGEWAEYRRALLAWANEPATSRTV